MIIKNKKKEIKKVIEEFDKAYKNDDFNLCMRKANILDYLNYKNSNYYMGFAFLLNDEYKNAEIYLKKVSQQSSLYKSASELLIICYMTQGKYIELNSILMYCKKIDIEEMYIRMICLHKMSISYFKKNKKEIEKIKVNLVKNDYIKSSDYFFSICYMLASYLVAVGECLNQCVIYCIQQKKQFNTFKVDKNVDIYVDMYEKSCFILQYSKYFEVFNYSEGMHSLLDYALYKYDWDNKLRKFYKKNYSINIAGLIFKLCNPNFHNNIDASKCIKIILELTIHIRPELIMWYVNEYFNILKEEYLKNNDFAIIYIGYVYSEIKVFKRDPYNLKEKIDNIWKQNKKYDLKKMSSDIKLARTLSLSGKLALDIAEETFQNINDNITGTKDYSALALQFFRIIEIEYNEKLIIPLIKNIDMKTFELKIKNNKGWYKDFKSILNAQKNGEISLGTIRVLLYKIIKYKDDEIGCYLFKAINKLLTSKGKENLKSEKMMRIINYDVLRNYRNPGAHTGYLPFSEACNVRKYVYKNLLIIEDWFV